MRIPVLFTMLLTTPAAAIAPVHLPPMEERTLDNGLKVVVAPRHQLPLVTVELLLDVGSAEDPAGKDGLATFTAELLRRGTKTRTAEEVDEAIEFVGGKLEAGAGPDATIVSADVTSEHLAVAMDVVADVATRPAFLPKELDSLRRRRLAELAQNLDEPAIVADRASLLALLPADHPYAHPSTGLAPAVRTFKRDDVVKFHGTRYGPSRATLIVVGDVETGEAVALAEKHLGGWKAKTAPAREVPAPEAPAKPPILVVHKERSTQAQVRFVGVAFPSRTEADFFPATVANAAFGGGFTSRLVDEIRVNRGLSYSVRSRFAHPKGAGFFVFSSFTKNETVGELLKVALAEAEKARKDGFKPEEISRARSYLAGLYPLRLETNGQIASAIGDLALYGLPKSWVSDYRSRLVEVEPALANDVAKRWFFAEPFAVVLVGDREAIQKGLAAAGLSGDVKALPIEALE